MHLARHQISSTNPIQVFDSRFEPDANIFTTVNALGFAVYRARPLQLLRKREFSGGTLAAAVPLHSSNIVFLLGGGASPLYPRNKVVVWDDSLGRAVAELEFSGRVCGLAVRRGWLAVALQRRVVVFIVGHGEQIRRVREWVTCENPRGLVAIATATHSTVLAICGRQTGHVQLIHLPPCPHPAPKSPPSPTLPSKPPPRPASQPISFINAHSTALTTLTVMPSGRLLATTSARGTLIRIWDTHTGQKLRQFRRGTDQAVIYGVAFRPDEQELCVWSDKGTVHVFALEDSARNRYSLFKPVSNALSLPGYYDSVWSYAQYRIPSQTSHLALTAASKSSDVVADERCVVAWIKYPLDTAGSPEQGASFEFQLIALTYSGGWYRLALPSSQSSRASTPQPATVASSSASSISHAATRTPRPRVVSGSGSSVTARSRPDKGKGKAKEETEGRECILQEFRRYGRWDGWG